MRKPTPGDTIAFLMILGFIVLFAIWLTAIVLFLYLFFAFLLTGSFWAFAFFAADIFWVILGLATWDLMNG